MVTDTSSTLSSAAFAKLSPHPYLLANLQASSPAKRINGRNPADARPLAINRSSLTHAHGSAVVRQGDTTVICGVRGETLLTSQIPNYRTSLFGGDTTGTTDELRDYDLLVPNIELATGCAPEFLPGVPPTTLAQTLSTRVYSLLHSSGILHVEDLRIYNQIEASTETTDDDDMQDADADVPTKEVKAYWVLYIDLLFVSLDGNPFDAAWAAVLAALRQTKLPHAYWDADREMVLCSRKTSPTPLSVSGLPVACSAAIFTAREKLKQIQSRKAGGDIGDFWILVDPDRFEESLCDEVVTVVVDRSEGGESKILGLSKSGGTIVGPDIIKRFVKVADDRWQALKTVL
ncbi:exosome complex exonuclease RRP43 [Xylariaceae sp. FL1272]|nr:exosome complex exonuclease RRP43 [Xylariaceae sp. FL1272]